MTSLTGEVSEYEEERLHLREGRGVHTPCTLPLDPPLVLLLAQIVCYKQTQFAVVIDTLGIM